MFDMSIDALISLLKLIQLKLFVKMLLHSKQMYPTTKLKNLLHYTCIVVEGTLKMYSS